MKRSVSFERWSYLWVKCSTNESRNEQKKFVSTIFSTHMYLLYTNTRVCINTACGAEEKGEEEKKSDNRHKWRQSHACACANSDDLHCDTMAYEYQPLHSRVNIGAIPLFEIYFISDVVIVIVVVNNGSEMNEKLHFNVQMGTIARACTHFLCK